jgi:hypothetical protein
MHFMGRAPLTQERPKSAAPGLATRGRAPLETRTSGSPRPARTTARPDGRGRQPTAAEIRAAEAGPASPACRLPRQAGPEPVNRARHRHCSDASRAARAGWNHEGLTFRNEGMIPTDVLQSRCAGKWPPTNLTRSSRGRGIAPRRSRTLLNCQGTVASFEPVSRSPPGVGAGQAVASLV